MSQRHSDIREMRTYVDGEGRKVHEFVQVYGKNRDPNIYRGEGMMKVVARHPMTGQPVNQNMNFEFPFPDGTTVKTAFDKFDEVAQMWADKHMEKQKEKAAADKVVAAKTIPKLMGPDGKPLLGGKK